MSQIDLLAVVPADRLSQLTKDELIEFLRLEQDFRKQLQADNRRLRALADEIIEKTFLIGERYIVLKNKLFGSSTERGSGDTPPSPSAELIEGHERRQRTAKKKIQLPSLRYPEAPLIERHVEFAEGQEPDCGCCGSKLKDSGMTEDSEFLTVIPAQYIVVRQKRHKYRCQKCHGDLQTAPLPPRIKEGSAYSDEMMVDVACAKYCDLIPVERYAQMADRAGLAGDLPPNTLIESTHYLADHLELVVEKIKAEVLAAKVLHADETPHRMLEGDKKKNWSLWGFSTSRASYFELHNTRSGDVASELLGHAQCEFLVSDVYSGYAKAVRETNVQRSERGQPLVRNIYASSGNFMGKG